MVKFQKWLKKIVLLPFWVLMGNIEASEPTAAPAAPETPAENVPAEGVEQAAESVSEESAETNKETPPEGTEESQSTEGETAEKRHQTTAAERIQELIAKNKQLESEMQARTSALEQKLEQVMSKQQSYDPDLQPVDHKAVNAYIAEQLAVYDQLKLEGRGVEALDLLEAVNKLRADVKAHEGKRAAKLAELQAKEQQGKTVKQVMDRLNKAAELVKTEYKMTDEVFNKAAAFFQGEQRKSPVLAARYAEIVEKQGEVAAILFAKDYCDQHMGKKEKEANEKREEGKKNLPPAPSATVNKTAAEEVNKLYEAAMKDPGNADKYRAWKDAKSKLK